MNDNEEYKADRSKLEDLVFPDELSQSLDSKDKMNFRMNQSDMKDKYFKLATESFFNEVGQDTILVRGKDFQTSGSPDQNDLKTCIQRVMVNLDKAIQEVKYIQPSEQDQADLNLTRAQADLVLTRANQTLQFIQALVMQAKWKLLKNEDNATSAEWTKGDIREGFSKATNDKDPPEVLAYLRKIIFKAVICCESVNFYFSSQNPKEIRARDTELEILEIPTDVREDLQGSVMKEQVIQSIKRDILRYFTIQKTIYKEVMQSTKQRPAVAYIMIEPEQSKQICQELSDEFKRWGEETQTDGKFFEEIYDMKNILFNVKKSVLTSLKLLIEEFVSTEDQDKMRCSLVSIAKVFQIYDTWRETCDEGENLIKILVEEKHQTKELKERAFRAKTEEKVEKHARPLIAKRVMERLTEQDKATFYDRFTGLMKMIEQLALEEKVCILRALPDLLTLLNLCQPENSSITFKDILTNFKKVVSIKNDEEAKNDEEVKIDETQHLQDALKISQKVENLTQHLQDALKISQKVENLTYNLSQNLKAFGTDENTNEEVEKKILGSNDQTLDSLSNIAQNTLSAAQKYEEKFNQDIPKLEDVKENEKQTKILNTNRQELAKKAQIAIKQAEEQLEEAQNGYDAARDMNTYFLQQIWLQNQTSIFEFFVKKRGLSEMNEELLSALWEMPKSPKSEIQVIKMRPEIMQYLTKLQNAEDINGQTEEEKDPAQGGLNQNNNPDQLNVYAKMLLAMGQALLNGTLMNLPLKSQNFVLNIFVKFLSTHMEDYRLRSDRSYIMRSVRKKESNLVESQMFSIVYFFLRQYFRWENNFKCRWSEERNIDSGDGFENLLNEREVKKKLMENAEQYFKMVFILKNSKENYQDLPTIIKQSYAFIDDYKEIYSMVFFRSMQYFIKEQRMEILFTSRKHLTTMLTDLRTNLSSESNALEFIEPFKSQGIKILYALLTKFCDNLSKKLIEEFSNGDNAVKEFRPIFVGTWLIMLQVFIIRSKQEQVGEEEQEEKDNGGVDARTLFANLLNFWKKTKEINNKPQKGRNQKEKDKQIEDQLENMKKLLIPTNDQVEFLRKNQIPALIELVGQEAGHDKYDTLQDLLKFLLLYAGLVFKQRNKSKEGIDADIILNNKNNMSNSKMINMLPILVNISEKQMLMQSIEYQEHCANQYNYLESCKLEDCETCVADNERNDSLLLIYFNNALNAINPNDGKKGFVTGKESEQYPSRYNNSCVTQSMFGNSTQQSQQTKIGQSTIMTLMTTQGGQMEGKKSQLADFLLNICDNFVQIERRIFLKKISKDKTFELLKEEYKRELMRQRVTKEEEKQLTEEMTRKINQEDAVIEETKRRTKPQKTKEIAARIAKIALDRITPEELDDVESIELLRKQFIQKWLKISQAMNIMKESQTEENWKKDAKDAKETEAYDYIQDEIIKEEEKEEIQRQEKLQNAKDVLKKLKAEHGNRTPMNEFHEAYSMYMLLKVKIKFQIFDTAEQILDATEECIQKQNNLRSMIPKESRSFFTVETAFILNESIEAINQLVIDNQTNEIWMENFLPKKESKIVDKIKEVVNQLGYAGFPLNAIRVQQDQMKKVINHDKIISQRLNLRNPKDEKETISELLKELKKWTALIAIHREEDVVEDPGYCGYIHMSFFGKDFPDELTHTKQGFILRAKYKIDLAPISETLRLIFSGKDKKYSYSGNDKLMQIISRTSPDYDPVPGEESYHWQDAPLIALSFEMQPMQDAILKTYYSSEDFGKFKQNSSENPRKNFTMQFTTNFKEQYFKESKSHNEELQQQYYGQINDDITKLAKELKRVQEGNTKQRDENTFEIETDLTSEQQALIIDKMYSKGLNATQITAEWLNWGYKKLEDIPIEEIQKRAVFQETEKKIYQVVKNEYEKENQKYLPVGDKISEVCWKTYSPVYVDMTGQVDDRTYQKQWKDIKFYKIGEIIKQKKRDRWTIPRLESYKKVLGESSKLWGEVEAKYAIEFAKKFIDQIKQYQQSTLSIYKVPLSFPAGFICQQVDTITRENISGPAKANLNIQEQMINPLYKLQKDYIEIRNKNGPTVFDKTEDLGKRAAAFKKLTEGAKFFLNEIQNYAISDVSGGIMNYLNLFFGKGCIHALNGQNSEFTDLLKIFRSIEKFIETIRHCLADFQRLQNECQACLRGENDGSQARELLGGFATDKDLQEQLDRYLNAIDDVVVKVEECRNENDLDNKIANERDRLDSEDEDWD